ncbi:hypothetical protein GALMADRAFT_157080 [Galerina marginata CBS 339.88]|uniref:Xylanolytic transcriptional activator regulatory domain-containing protein n=1 Tax=Galerina marginata (strain CBS 339.88) TaxID=685588 RepID=A0A067T5L0_GALM3|nr:hypothetical protein GALMADRAFT_157080 [Galerina marginata CBS 339.88]
MTPPVNRRNRKPSKRIYIHSLEEKLAKMERYLHKLHPDQDIDSLLELPVDEIPKPSIVSVDDTRNTGSFSYPELKYPIPQSVSTETAASASTPSEQLDDSDLSEADDFGHVALAEHLSVLSLNAVHDRFFGQSSAFMFTKHASNVRSEVTGASSRLDPSKFRRPIFWDMRPWEMAYAMTPEPPYVYPEEDLSRSLVALYFEKMNTAFPVLHQPTFLKSFSLGQHLWDATFGMTLLQVCALGSRFSQDPRVIVPNDPTGLSAGWQYFCQVPMIRKSLLHKSTLYDLQYYCLATLYLVGTSIPHASWIVLGIGMRYAIEKGAHRRKGYNQRPSVEDEQLKRAFWSLVCIDRIMSSFLGRPSTIQDEEFDVEYPIECDDEYWETGDPEQAFKQPAGKPCSMTSFVCFVKLCEILGFALRTLYSTQKSKILSGLIGHEWQSRIVAELDSSMNKWIDSLPYFLRWDPDRRDSLFFHQSVTLYATYYYIQIQIHRPFLTKKSSLSFSSLAMCTNAARSCSHVLEAAVTRGIRVTPNLTMAAFSSGIVIVLNLLGNQRGDRESGMADLQKCLDVLKECEKRWHSAGRLRDMLTELASINEYQPTFNKRRHESISTDTKSRQSSGFTSNFSKQTQSISPGIPYMATNSNEPILFDSAATMPSNDWDLSNLLLIQMGYIQANAKESLEKQNFNVVPPTPGISPLPEYGNVIPPDFAMSDDMFALWSDIPDALSVEGWDAYLSGMRQSQ